MDNLLEVVKVHYNSDVPVFVGLTTYGEVEVGMKEKPGVFGKSFVEIVGMRNSGHSPESITNLLVNHFWNNYAAERSLIISKIVANLKLSDGPVILEIAKKLKI